MKLRQCNFITSVIFLCTNIIAIETKSIHLGLIRSTQPERDLNLTKSSAQETNNPKVCTTDQCKNAAEYILRNMNTNALPCHNFHQFACGNYHKWHPLPDYIDRMNPFRERQDLLLQISADALKNRIYESDATPFIRKARELFESCMDEEAIEKLGDLPIPIELNTLDLPIEPPFFGPIKRFYNLSTLLGKMHRHAVMGKFLFDTSVFVNQLDNTKNHFAFDYTPAVTKFETMDERNEEIMELHRSMNRRTDYAPLTVRREALIEYMIKVINYVRENISSPFAKKAKSSITKEVAEVADFLIAVEQTKSKESRLTTDHCKPFTYTTIPDLQKMTDKIFQKGTTKIRINWLDYTETLFLDIDNVRQSFATGETIMFIVHNLRVELINWKLVRAIWWMTVEPLTPYGTKALREIRKEFHKQIEKPKKYDREHRCIFVVRSHFPFLLGYILLKQTDNPEQLRENVTAMVDNIHRAFADTVTINYWLDSATKMAILNKLHHMSRIIAFHDWMLQAESIGAVYENLNVYPNSLYLSRKNIRKNAREHALRLLHKINDFQNGKCPNDPTAANGGYFPLMNTIDIPIALLGPPFYDLGLASLNYGAIGVILGHEMGHAFDNFGRMYNSKGMRVHWWKKSTYEMYQYYETCFVNEYNNLRIPGLIKTVDGQLTLGENIADIIGFTQALKAYHHLADKKDNLLLPGLELFSQEKLFTLAFANLFCDNVEPGYREWQLSADEHSPGPARINGVARNSRDFARIWHCSTKTYMNPPKKCVLW